MAHWLVDFAKTLHVGGGRGVESGGLHINFIQPTNNRVPRGSPRLGHVAPNHLTKYATCHHPIRCKQATSYANYPHFCLPCVVRPCHVSYGLPRQHPYGLYSQHIFLTCLLF